MKPACPPLLPARLAAGIGPLLTLLLLATPALADSPTPLPPIGNLPDVGLSVIRALGALALVLAVFFGGVWLYRNGQRLAWRKSGAPKLAILESRSLGNRFALHVIGYEQQRLLIASSPAGISMLSHLPALPAGSELADPHPETGAFSDCLQQVLRPK
jgi:flagellar biogenesis protein FliO